MAASALLLGIGASLYALSPTAHPEPTRPDGASELDWVVMLAGLPDEGFDRLSGPWQLVLPDDHGAHPDARTESWNIAAHLRNDRGEDVGFQFALFRAGLPPTDAPPPMTPWVAHELYRGHVTLLGSPQRHAAGEERFRRGLPGIAGYDAAHREVRLDNWLLQFGEGERGMQLSLEATVGEVALVALLLTPAKAAVTSNPDGADAPFRGFSITRMVVEGHIKTEDGRQPVSGHAWLDHLWGDLPLPIGPIAWDRLQLQLDDGTDLSVTRARRRDGSGTPTLSGYAVDPQGGVEQLESASLQMKSSRTWRPDPEGAPYPLDWQLGAGDLKLEVEPLVDDQIHAFAAPLWSGIVTAEGSLRDRPISGVGTLQLTGYATQ